MNTLLKGVIVDSLEILKTFLTFVQEVLMTPAPSDSSARIAELEARLASFDDLAHQAQTIMDQHTGTVSPVEPPFVQPPAVDPTLVTAPEPAVEMTPAPEVIA